MDYMVSKWSQYADGKVISLCIGAEDLISEYEKEIDIDIDVVNQIIEKAIQDYVRRQREENLIYQLRNLINEAEKLCFDEENKKSRKVQTILIEEDVFYILRTFSDKYIDFSDIEDVRGDRVGSIWGIPIRVIPTREEAF